MKLIDAPPKYTHDCDGCRYLGRLTVEGREYDIYKCDQCESFAGGTWLARYDNEGSRYWSMPQDILLGATGQMTPLMEAMREIAKHWDDPKE